MFFRVKIRPQSTRQIYEFLGFKKGKKVTSVDFSQVFLVISQSRHNKLQKREKTFYFIGI